MGTNADDIEINNATGLMEFKNTPDYETKSTYSAIAQVYDDSFMSQQAFQILINNLNDNDPSFTSNASFNVNENQTTIGTVSANDADGDVLSFSVSGTDASSVSIDSTSGALNFKTAPDYENKTSYSFTVTASDGSNSTDQPISVTINNLNDNDPSFTSSASFAANENQTAIGTVTATDADGDNIVFSISGADSSSVSIGSSSGVLVFNSAPDYELKSSYSITVTASDGTNSSDQAVSVAVGNLNDNAPVFTSSNTLSANEADERISDAYYISWGNVSATDADGSSLTYGWYGEFANNNIGSGFDYDTSSNFKINM